MSSQYAWEREEKNQVTFDMNARNADRDEHYVPSQLVGINKSPSALLS